MGGSQDSVGQVDYAVNSAELGAGASLHIAQDGTASRSSPNLGVQTAVLDPATVADLHAQIEAADFPALEASYIPCQGPGDGICPPLAFGPFHVTAQVAGDSYTTGGDLAILSYDDGVPSGFLATVRSLQNIIENSDWH
jgi:hypothetical protein